jgi:hypothetical protein
MCPTASDPAFLQEMALERHASYSSESCLPIGEESEALRVLQLQILPPCRGGPRSAMCPTFPDPASVPEGLRCCHRMSCGFSVDHEPQIYKERLS